MVGRSSAFYGFLWGILRSPWTRLLWRALDPSLLDVTCRRDLFRRSWFRKWNPDNEQAVQRGCQQQRVSISHQASDSVLKAHRRLTHLHISPSQDSFAIRLTAIVVLAGCARVTQRAGRSIDIQTIGRKEGGAQKKAQVSNLRLRELSWRGSDILSCITWFEYSGLTRSERIATGGCESAELPARDGSARW